MDRQTDILTENAVLNYIRCAAKNKILLNCPILFNNLIRKKQLPSDMLID